MENVKLRIPDAWEGRLRSEDVRVIMQDWFSRRYPLPPDPGPGRTARVSLNLPPRAVKVLEGLTGESPSVALRRLIAANVLTFPHALHLASSVALYGRPIVPLPARQVAALPPSPTAAMAGQAESEEMTLFWLLVAAVVVGFVIWRFFVRDTPAGLILESATAAPIAKELPNFVQWIPKGLP